MNANDTEAAGMNPDTVANDLTQLSSREQLSALMDGALPADQTRFLLRRLQHDASLAGSWERWRLTGEVMRGLAPAQRLPADFASRVSAALHGDVVAAPASRSARTPAWLRWGGGAAMAASLAVVALMARQSAGEVAPAAVQVASAKVPAAQPSVAASPGVPSTDDSGRAARVMAAASAVAVASNRPPRERNAVQQRVPAPSASATSPALDVQVAVGDSSVLGNGTTIPQPDIVTRPWPRSVLPQYASSGLAVGFGEHVRGASAYNPFQAQAGIGSLPPVSDASQADGDAPREPQATSADPQRGTPPQP
jgi:negative regulator of sigma E activity